MREKQAKRAMAVACRPKEPVLFVPFLIFGLVLLMAGASAEESPLEVMTVGYDVSPRERTWDGTVEAVNRGTVSAQTSGRVKEIYYDVNDFVESGGILMRFTDIEQQAAYQRAGAALEEAEARAREASSEFARIRQVYEAGTVSKSFYEQAEANVKAAQARLDGARSGLAQAKQQLDYTVVRAPYAGIVSERHVEVGEMVSPGQRLMSGLSLAELRINVDVPQSMFEPIRTIRKAYIYAGEHPIEAAGLTFYPVADPETNTFRVRVDMPAESAVLYPGMFVKVGFVVGETERLLIPASAVVQRSELSAVYVVKD
jgi:RND family efflux transporter MFP subunit